MRECLRRCDELGEEWARGTALWVRGAARWLSGDIGAAIEDFERAAVLHGAGDALWTTLAAPVLMGPAYAEIRKDGAATARGRLGDERFEALMRRGLARPLTRREAEIADLVAAGLGNRDIAERLFLSKRTVDSHIDHIFTKLHFSSRTQLVNWVLRQRKGAGQ